MNNILNVKRLALNFRKDLLENGKRYLLLFLTMFGLITIILTFISWEHYRSVNLYYEQNKNALNEPLLTAACFLFAGFGLLFASTLSQPMNNKIKRISYLVYPASNLEKFLTRWLLLTVGYIIAFLTALWMADIIRMGICSAYFPEHTVSFLDLTKLVYFDDGDWNQQHDHLLNGPIFAIIISIYFLFQSLFILGATFWEKTSFVKTFTAGIVIILTFVLVYRWTILFCYGDFAHLGNALESLLDPIKKIEMNEDRIITEKQVSLFVSLLISLFTLTNWTLSFFRFRESEIIKRL